MQKDFSANSYRLSPATLATEIPQSLAPNPLDINKLGVSSSSNAPIVGQPLVVYDGSTNKLLDNAASPNGPWFYYQDTTAILGGTATPSTTGIGTKLTTNNQAYAGYINYSIDTTTPTKPKLVTLNNSFPTLDPSAGYIISFTAQIESETARVGADKNADGKDDRAGFSVIVIGNDKKGIELGFWSNRIWVQNDGAAEPNPSNLNNTLFTQGEGVDFNTKIKAVKYDLAITGNSYSLFADNNRILTGSVRDYTPFLPGSYTVPVPIVGSINITPPDPYEQANFVFFGDNTPTAGATVNLNNVTIKAVAKEKHDFDGDRKAEVLWRNLSTGEDAIWKLNEFAIDSSAFINPEIKDSNWKIITSGDFNGDKKADILWRNTATGENSIWLRNGFNDFDSNSKQLITSAPIGWDIVGTGDLNGDNKDDLVWRNQTTGENGVWFMDSFTVNPQFFSNKVIPTDWEMTGVGYFDDDNKADVVWRNKATGENAIWLMDGAQLKEARFITTIADKNWKIVAVNDSNNDGKDDILWRNQATGEIAVWFVNTAQLDGNNFSISGDFIVDKNATRLQVTSADWTIEAFADYNGDGKADLLWHNQASGEIGLWWLDTTTAIRTELVTNNGSIIKIDKKWQITL
jgi:FG-GAP-like repeat